MIECVHCVVHPENQNPGDPHRIAEISHQRKRIRDLRRGRNGVDRWPEFARRFAEDKGGQRQNTQHHQQQRRQTEKDNVSRPRRHKM